MGLRLLIAFELQQNNAAKLIQLLLASGNLRVIRDDLVEQSLNRSLQQIYRRLLEVTIHKVLLVVCQAFVGARKVTSRPQFGDERSVTLSVQERRDGTRIWVVGPNTKFCMRLIGEICFKLRNPSFVVRLLALNHECEVLGLAYVIGRIKDGDVDRVSLK